MSVIGIQKVVGKVCEERDEGKATLPKAAFATLYVRYTILTRASTSCECEVVGHRSDVN
jgi:hypothetical protein